MLEWLDQLREKPEHVRFRFALIAAGGITLIIFLVWLSIVSLRIDEGGSVQTDETTSEPSPFSIFSERFSEFFTEGKERISEGIDVLGTIEYEAPIEEE